MENFLKDIKKIQYVTTFFNISVMKIDNKCVHTFYPDGRVSTKFYKYWSKKALSTTTEYTDSAFINLALKPVLDFVKTNKKTVDIVDDCGGTLTIFYNDGSKKSFDRGLYDSKTNKCLESIMVECLKAVENYIYHSDREPLSSITSKSSNQPKKAPNEFEIEDQSYNRWNDGGGAMRPLAPDEENK